MSPAVNHLNLTYVYYQTYASETYGDGQDWNLHRSG